MQQLRYFLLAAGLFLVMGCYEITEEISINGDGSGTYSTKMDMSALIEMMQSMAGEKELGKDGLDRPLDTLIMLKDVMDSVKNLTPEQRELYHDGSMNLQMNRDEKIFKFNMSFPYKDRTQLKTFMSGGGARGMPEVFKRVYRTSPDSTGNGSGNDSEKAPADEGFDMINSIFDISVADGKVSKQLNKQKYQELMLRPEVTQAREMSKANQEVPYTTIIKFPRPVKKTDNRLIKLSADKKTATIKYNLLTLFETPEKFSYTIVY